MDRKKKLRIYQFFFLFFGLLIVLVTFLQKDNVKNNKIISQNLKKTIDDQQKNQNSDNNIFYNVKYSGLDLEGNRYSISSEEAINSTSNSSVVEMKKVSATFYFKDNTILSISSGGGTYNNKTLDMEFRQDVKALYQNSELYAEKAEFLNSKNSLVISDNVRVIDTKGSMFADKLIFDIKEKTLNIKSLNNKMIKSKLNYKWKKVLDSPIFEIQDISKSFNGRPVLKKLSLKVYPGECVGILGPNGCGKTTLFSMCIGELSPDNGKIFLRNKPIHEIPIHLRAKEGLGYLPQQRSVFNMSVYDNIMGIAQISIKGVDSQKSVTEKLLDEFNLQHLRSLNASVLSGGEIRRLMMARIMINKPKIVLLDEPLAALDPLVIQDIQRYILKIQSSGTAILVTDHNVKNLFDITDRSYVLGEHNVIAEGTSSELLKSSKAIKHYFGSQFS